MILILVVVLGVVAAASGGPVGFSLYALFVILFIMLAQHESKAQKEKGERSKAKRLQIIERRRADTHDRAYSYEISARARRELAVRYGIAHQRREFKAGYTYSGTRGKIRNEALDRFETIESTTIWLRKIEAVQPTIYTVTLEEYADTKAVARIENDKLLSFLEPHEGWDEENPNLSALLRASQGIDLKDLATEHIRHVIPT